jgi:hypothetical protein
MCPEPKHLKHLKHLISLFLEGWKSTLGLFLLVHSSFRLGGSAFPFTTT